MYDLLVNHRERHIYYGPLSHPPPPVHPSTAIKIGNDVDDYDYDYDYDDDDDTDPLLYAVLPT